MEKERETAIQNDPELSDQSWLDLSTALLRDIAAIIVTLLTTKGTRLVSRFTQIKQLPNVINYAGSIHEDVGEQLNLRMKNTLGYKP